MPQDSGILNENASDSLSSGSDSGFYHTGSGSGGSRDHNDASTATSSSSIKSSSVAGQSSPRYSTCSSRCSSSEFDPSPNKTSRGTATEASTLKRTRQGELRNQHWSMWTCLFFVSCRGRPPSHRGSNLERRHSRASSVDRREIFKKYITNGSEHEENLRPFADDDTELLKAADEVRQQQRRR